MQEGRHWLRHYRSYCYLPLYVFAGRHLLAAVLQPSDRDAAWRAGAVLALLVRALRREWPDVDIVFRGDCGKRSFLMTNLRFACSTTSTTRRGRGRAGGGWS